MNYVRFVKCGSSREAPAATGLTRKEPETSKKVADAIYCAHLASCQQRKDASIDKGRADRLPPPQTTDLQFEPRIHKCLKTASSAAAAAAAITALSYPHLKDGLRKLDN